jgi:hypothetical protein
MILMELEYLPLTIFAHSNQATFLRIRWNECCKKKRTQRNLLERAVEKKEQKTE